MSCVCPHTNAHSPSQEIETTSWQPEILVKWRRYHVECASVCVVFVYTSNWWCARREQLVILRRGSLRFTRSLYAPPALLADVCWHSFRLLPPCLVTDASCCSASSSNRCAMFEKFLRIVVVSVCQLVVFDKGILLWSGFIFIFIWKFFGILMAEYVVVSLLNFYWWILFCLRWENVVRMCFGIFDIFTEVYMVKWRVGIFQLVVNLFFLSRTGMGVAFVVTTTPFLASLGVPRLGGSLQVFFLL